MPAKNTNISLHNFENINITSNDYLRKLINNTEDNILLEPYFNGKSQLVNKIKVDYITEIEECKKIWNKYSKNKDLFDLWEYRINLVNNYNLKPFFICIKDNYDNILSILPLSFNNIYNEFHWIGSYWTENNYFLTDNPYYIPLMLFLAPKPLNLFAILPIENDKLKKLINFQKDDDKYILDINLFSNHNDFLRQLKKKKRHNLRRDYKNIIKHNPKLYFNRFEDFDDIVRISKGRFLKKKQLPIWDQEPPLYNALKSLINSKNVFSVRFVTAEINGKIAAVDYIIIYKNIYYTFIGGYDVQKYPGIGNYMNLIEIDDALDMGIGKMDFLQTDYSWKNSMLTPIKLHKYIKI